MTFKHFKQSYPNLILFVFACMLPLFGNNTPEQVISEKRIRVAMRMIGHEVLLCLGDSESRIMPIEKVDEHYKIPFEFEFGFDPDDIVSIIDRVMIKTRIATNYLVEVVQCESKEVVHSFEVGNAVYSDLIVCGGRILPEDCYSILITLLDDESSYANLSTSSSDSSSTLSTEELSSDILSLSSSKTKKASPLNFTFLIVPLLFLIGLFGYFFKKKNHKNINPNVILIGAFQFDKRNMTLSFDNNRIELSHKEAELLSLLRTKANTPIERGVILQRVWGDEGAYVGRTLDVFISKLRKKLEADASVKIVNIRGIGYKLVMDI